MEMQTARAKRAAAKKEAERRQSMRRRPASSLCAQASQPISHLSAAHWFGVPMWNGERPGFVAYIEEERQGTQRQYQVEKSPRQRAGPPCESLQPEQRRFARDAQQTGRSAASHPNRPACHRSLGGQWWQEGDPRPALWTRKRRPRKPCPACAAPRSEERK